MRAWLHLLVLFNILIIEIKVSICFRLRDQLTKLGEEFHGFLTDPQYIVKFMNPGRLVKVIFVLTFRKYSLEAKTVLYYNKIDMGKETSKKFKRKRRLSKDDEQMNY